jgi:hypothetical protein
MEADVIDQIFSASEKRPARLLFANYEREPANVPINLNQERMIGTTRSRVGFFYEQIS